MKPNHINKSPTTAVGTRNRGEAGQRRMAWTPRKSNGALIGTIIAGVACAAVWYSQNQTANDSPTSDSDLQLVYQTVGVMQIAESSSTWIPHRYTATVVPRRTSQLGFEASERVIEILVDEGQAVEQGQVLAKQDATVLRAQVSAAVASRAQAKAILAELIQGPRQETLDAARSELNRLKTQVKLAEVTLNRQKRLRAASAGSGQEYDAARFDSAAAQAAADSAAHRLSELESGTRKEKLDAQRATLAITEAAVEQANIRLNQAILIAPFSGRITKRFIDEGQLPAKGEPILEVIESEQLEVRFGAALKIAAKLNLGDSIPFSSDDQQFEGILAQISPRLDAATRTREVIVNLSPGDADQIVPGQTVKIEFALQSKEPGFWLPSEALQPQVRGLWSVMVLETDRNKPDTAAIDRLAVTRHDVEILSTWGNWSRVRGTLAGGEQVVVQGASRVSPGQKVESKLIHLTPPWESTSTAFVARRTANSESINASATDTDPSEVVQ